MRLKKGFTIVEVSLVVAIGGLILVGALIAVPNLLRTSRDAQRKTDMETLVSAIKKYQTNNNRGALPENWSEFRSDFLSDFADPNGYDYTLDVFNCNKAADVSCSTTGHSLDGLFPNDYKMFVVVGAKCKDNSPVGSSNQRKFAVLYRLETNDLFCLEG